MILYRASFWCFCPGVNFTLSLEAHKILQQKFHNYLCFIMCIWQPKEEEKNKNKNKFFIFIFLSLF